MLSTGEIIDGKYRIVRLIGEGGMGAVYEGENTRIHRRVAIKVLHAGVAETAEAVARFEREAQAAGRIGSEHIVEVLDLGNLQNGDRYMVMEFMDGDSLSARIRQRGRIAPAELAPIADQLLEALVAAHGAGIIHRDMKPDNVFLLKTRGGRADFVKLLDFGISKFNQLSGDSGFSMTRTGAVMGTPYYMAPEQAKGAKSLDHRVDIYAVGVILYECVTGQVPFNADTFNELLFKIVLEEPQPIQQLVAGMDPAFVAIINKGMAREPGLRFASAREFQDALRSWAAGAGIAIGDAGRAMRPSIADTSGMHAGVPSASLAGTPTPGSWAKTGTFPETPAATKKNTTGLVVALAAAGVLVLGGGALAVAKLTNGTPEATAVATLPATPPAAPVNAEEHARLERERADAEKAKAEAEKPEAEAEKAKAAVEEAKAALVAAKPQAVVKAPVPRPVRAKSVVAAKAPAKEPPKPPPAAPVSTSTGRKIRTSL